MSGIKPYLSPEQKVDFDQYVGALLSLAGIDPAHVWYKAKQRFSFETTAEGVESLLVSGYSVPAGYTRLKDPENEDDYEVPYEQVRSQAHDQLLNLLGAERFKGKSGVEGWLLISQVFTHWNTTEHVPTLIALFDYACQQANWHKWFYIQTPYSLRDVPSFDDLYAQWHEIDPNDLTPEQVEWLCRPTHVWPRDDWGKPVNPGCVRRPVHTSLEHCPYCNAITEADFCDVGVGMVQCGPYHCDHCGASQIGPHDDRDRVLNQAEKNSGWYYPNSEPGSSANVVLGTHVSVDTMTAMYRKLGPVVFSLRVAPTKPENKATK